MDDELIVELAELAARGVHDPARMPFTTAWTRGTPEEVKRSVLAYQWATRSAVSSVKFRLEYAVLVDGVVVGSQGAGSTDWTATRGVGTGSWLGREYQGRGIGTRMRALILYLLFSGLGASEATTGAFADNPASNGVSRKLGYENNGIDRVARDGMPAISNRYRMSRERWLEMRDGHAAYLGAPVVLEGVEALREQIDAAKAEN